MPAKRRRRKKRAIPISEIPVIEVITPKINVYGHEPQLQHLQDGSYIGGCSCGWQSRARSRNDNVMRSWWKHAREINNGNLVMNGKHEASEG